MAAARGKAAGCMWMTGHGCCEHVRREWEEWEGVISCKVKIPDCYIPPLPVHSGRRLFFPIGEVHGEWTILELRRALIAGVTLLSVDWVLGSDVTFNPFQQFTESLFSLRSQYLSSGSQAANFVKLLLNSLYGRGLNLIVALYNLVRVDENTDWEGFALFNLSNSK
jgi:hypothetical protein